MAKFSLIDVCDKILIGLNRENPGQSYTYTAGFVLDYGKNAADTAVEQLLKDGYIHRGNDRRKSQTDAPNYGYTISAYGSNFVEQGGYMKKFERENKKTQYEIDLPKSILRTNKFIWLTFGAILLGAIFQFFTLVKDDRVNKLQQELQGKNLMIQSLQDRLNLLSFPNRRNQDSSNMK